MAMPDLLRDAFISFEEQLNFQNDTVVNEKYRLQKNRVFG